MSWGTNVCTVRNWTFASALPCQWKKQFLRVPYTCTYFLWLNYFTQYRSGDKGPHCDFQKTSLRVHILYFSYNYKHAYRRYSINIIGTKGKTFFRRYTTPQNLFLTFFMLDFCEYVFKRSKLAATVYFISLVRDL